MKDEIKDTPTLHFDKLNVQFRQAQDSEKSLRHEKTSGNQPEVIHQSKNEQYEYTVSCR